MAEELSIDKHLSKKEQHLLMLKQIRALVEGEKDLIANLANISAALKQGFNYFWVGFYLIKNNELVLGPFQGTIACTRIAYGKGVCGAAWEQKKSLLVPDVDQFPGHIACSSMSKSEVVVPVMNKMGDVIMVLDVDSDKINDFDESDVYFFENIGQLITEMIIRSV